MKSLAFYTLALLGAASIIYAADTQKQQQVQQEIEQVFSNLNNQQSQSTSIQKEITRLEQKLGDISRQQFQTEKKIDEVMSRLQGANEKKLKLDSDLKQQKAGLAQQLQALYTAGNQSHLRLLLRQDEPSDISRTIRYFEYMNDSRIKRIQKVNKTVKEMNTVHLTIDQDRQTLEQLNKSLEQQKSELQSTLSARSDALVSLKRDIRTNQQRLNELKQEDADLQAVVTKLSKKNEATANENKNSAKEVLMPAPTQATSTPRDTGSKPIPNTIITAETAAALSPSKPFANLRGKMNWPIAGKIIHPYNSARNEKQRWRGVVIAAPGGTRVKAIARGRVAFAGWMNGYGHLIIIEHDHTYMSLYGYNRAVYKREGDIVQANETIAAVGNSSGQSQDALYFEVRQGTDPQNPARWCR